MDNLLLDPFVRLLGEVSTPAAVRHAEETGDAAAVWRAVAESGFADALVPEDKGGAGLALADMLPLLLAAGEHLLPVPFGETMLARALIAGAGLEAPADRPILLWPATADGRLRSQAGAAAAGDAYALVQKGGSFALLPAGTGSADPFRITIATVDPAATPLLRFDAPGVDLLGWAAALTAANMAGAMSRVLDMTLSYANERQQFGRPLGKFQAIQHQLSVMAEKVVAGNVAARIALSGALPALPRWRAATAKCTANEAASDVAAIAHAVHGAIGVSEEHDLQLYTRRLKRWQLAFGSDSFWARQLGAERLAAGEGTSVDFVRQKMAEAV